MSATEQTAADLIRHLGPCEDALAWARCHPDAESAWKACGRGDWMLWLLGAVSGKFRSNTHRPLVRLVCEAARLVLPAITQHRDRHEAVIARVEQWVSGDDSVTRGDLWALSNAASEFPPCAPSASFSEDKAATYASYSIRRCVYIAAARPPLKASCHLFAEDVEMGIGKRVLADLVRKHFPEPPEVKDL